MRTFIYCCQIINDIFVVFKSLNGLNVIRAQKGKLIDNTSRWLHEYRNMIHGVTEIKMNESRKPVAQWMGNVLSWTHTSRELN